jgi:hypothetical protein
MKFQLKIVLMLIVLASVVAGGYSKFLKNGQPTAHVAQEAVVSPDGSSEPRTPNDDQTRVTEQLAASGASPDKLDRVNPLDSSSSFSAVEGDLLKGRAGRWAKSKRS